MRVARWLSVAVAVLFLAGCGQTHAKTHGSALRLTEKDKNKTFTVKLHEALVFTFASNRSVGWAWFEQSAPDVGSVGLRLVSHRYVVSKTSVPGAAGEEIWRFRAAAKGAYPVDFVYGLRQHPDTAPVLGFTINIS